MRPSLLATAFVVLACAAPAWAHEHHAAAPTAVQHTHTSVVTGPVKATFHFSAPEPARFTCSMHPTVVADKPGKCPTCKMALVKQTHTIGVELADAKSDRALGAAAVRLVVTDASGMAQTLDMGMPPIGQFALAPGKYTIKATITPKGGKPVQASTPYVVK